MLISDWSSDVCSSDLLLWGNPAQTASLEAERLPAKGRRQQESFGGSMAVIEGVKRVLQETLQLGDRVERFDPSTPLFGSIPEFDSMAVVTVVTALEEQFDIAVDDDDISADIFETLGSLARFVEANVEACPAPRP